MSMRLRWVLAIFLNLAFYLMIHFAFASAKIQPGFCPAHGAIVRNRRRTLIIVVLAAIAFVIGAFSTLFIEPVPEFAVVLIVAAAAVGIVVKIWAFTRPCPLHAKKIERLCMARTCRHGIP